jgi:plastocyanin
MLKKLRRTKFALIALTALLSVVLSGCTWPQIKGIRDEPQEETDTPEAVETTDIIIQNNQLTPKLISIAVGQTVTYTNLDKSPHSIASDPYPDNSDLPDLYSAPIYKDESYKYTFQKAGTFGYHLQENPSVRGEAVVQ